MEMGNEEHQLVLHVALPTSSLSLSQPHTELTPIYSHAQPLTWDALPLVLNRTSFVSFPFLLLDAQYRNGLHFNKIKAVALV